MADTVEGDIKALQDEIRQLRRDLSDIAATLRDTVQHGREEVVERARESGEHVQHKATKAAQDAIHEIEEKPLSSALTAFGVGLVMGLLMHGRRS
jgi:ElaB/YqjD/DUF883 family membrane-anchored ribosome-binding protein